MIPLIILVLLASILLAWRAYDVGVQRGKGSTYKLWSKWVDHLMDILNGGK